MTTVVLADDEALLRKAMAALLPLEGEITVLAVVDDCPLTDREIDVLRVTRDGYSVADIATHLHLAEGTVRNYLSNAMQKTQTRTRHGAARYAREHDWL